MLTLLGNPLARLLPGEGILVWRKREFYFSAWPLNAAQLPNLAAVGKANDLEFEDDLFRADLFWNAINVVALVGRGQVGDGFFY